MLATIWSGAGSASDVFMLIAAVLAGLDAVLRIVNGELVLALLPAAVALVALGLLAV